MSASALTFLRGRSRARCRLARKAESARQARLRHKQFVTDLQDQAAGLHARIRELEAHCTTGPGSAAVAMRELKAALTPEQQSTLVKWCAAPPARTAPSSPSYRGRLGRDAFAQPWRHACARTRSHARGRGCTGHR